MGRDKELSEASYMKAVIPFMSALSSFHKDMSPFKGSIFSTINFGVKFQHINLEGTHLHLRNHAQSVNAIGLCKSI